MKNKKNKKSIKCKANNYNLYSLKQKQMYVKNKKNHMTLKSEHEKSIYEYKGLKKAFWLEFLTMT